MYKTIITARESYDWIMEEKIGVANFEALLVYIEEKYPNKKIIELRYKQFRFINYVGVIVCNGVRYEIRPKINLSIEDERQSLLSMLSITNFLPISFGKSVQGGTEENDLLSIFLSTFLNRLLTELKKGPYKTYETHTDNLNVLKGKIELTKHIQKNAFHKDKVYCSFDEYTTNNTLNQLFKTALNIIQQNVQLSIKKLTLDRCLGYLEEVDVSKINSNKLNNLIFNRQNERFKDIALFAKMIVEKRSIYSYGKHSSSFSFLFPMNLLFEEYIEVGLREVAGTNEVISQHAEKRLLINRKSGRENILLKPDFVISDKLIIDTKWKSATYNNKTIYNQSDIYQMYAYVTSYENVNRCIILYPQKEEEADHPIWEVVESDKTIEMHTVRLNDFNATLSDLKELVSNS